MTTYTELYAQLRSHLLGELHIGRMKPGDRLPSMRETARRSGVDHRVVARAYGALAAEGLVEVRGRSGVVIAGQRRGDVEPVGGASQWLSRILCEAWTRRIALPDLPTLLERATKGVRCACIESTEDHEVAICSELDKDFGLDVRPVRLDGDMDPEGDRQVVDHVLAEVDMVVTTSFHAPLVTRAAASLRKEVIIASVNPLVRQRIADMLERGGIRVVIADPAYADRARAYMRGFEEGTHYSFVLADDPEVGAVLAEPERALLTRAARRRLGVEEYHLVEAAAPFLSLETAQEIAAAMVRINFASPPPLHD